MPVSSPLIVYHMFLNPRHHCCCPQAGGLSGGGAGAKGKQDDIITMELLGEGTFGKVGGSWAEAVCLTSVFTAAHCPAAALFR
jgi:hypothetical protein